MSGSLAPRPIRFATQAGQESQASGSRERLVNLFAEPASEGSTSEMVLRNTPGLSLAYTVGPGPIQYVSNDSATGVYVVSGGRFYRGTAPSGALTFTYLGDVGSSGTPAPGIKPDIYTTAENSDFSVVCAPPYAYAAKLTDTRITLINATVVGPLLSVTGVVYVGGYFVFTTLNSSQFYVSKSLDPYTYDPLDFATAEATANILLRPVAHLDRLWLMGAQGIEIWYLSGDADFPFRLDAGGVIYEGVLAVKSIGIADGSIFFLSNQRAILRTEGYKAVRISTDEIEAEMRDYWSKGTDIAQSVQDAVTFAFEGKEFYAITLQFPGDAGRTWVYSCAARRWHEVSSNVEGNGRWRVNCGSGGLLGDLTTGSLFLLGDDVPYDYDTQVARIAVSSPLYANTVHAFMSRFEIDCERGPTPATLSWTDDDGRSWATGRSISLATKRSSATRLGSFTKRSLRLTFGTGHMRVYGAYAMVEAGQS